MALQVWLPLNGDLRNQGLSNIMVTNDGAIIDDNGKIGKCYSFNNTHIIIDSVQLQNLFSSVTQPFSMACWIYLNTDETDRVIIFGNYNANPFVNWELAANGTQRVCVGGSSNYTSKASSLAVPKTTWTHIAFTYDGTITKFYQNGIKTNESSGSNTLTTKTTSSRFYLGSDTRTGATRLKGKLNDFRIYDHALSDKEVEEISKGLILHYKLDGDIQYLVPSEYQQLEYIENTADAYINTYDKFNPEIDSCKIVYQGNDITNNGMLFASYGSTNYVWFYYYGAANRIGIYLHDGTAQSSVYKNNGNDLNKHTILYNNKKFYFDNIFQGTLSSTYTETFNNMCLFARSAGTNTFNGKIYYIEIMRNNQIKHIYIPVKQLSTQKIGMYDIINNTFRSSMNSTNFIAGPIVSLTKIYDSSGYGNDGTIIGSLSAVADSARYDCATNLMTTSSKIEITNLTTIGFSNTYTFAWWGKVSAYGRYMMWGFADGARLNGIYYGNLWNTNDGQNNPLYIPGTTTQVTAPSVNEWHHFAMIGNGTQCLVYKDGELWGQAKTYKSISGTTIYLNGWENNTSYSLANTILSDFRIYATALTEAQIKELYNTSATIDNLGNAYARELVE